MDTIRDGAFGLTNTNRLVRYYRGCTGLKTGSTAKAGFCVSVTANRDGMELICVIMGAKTRDERNAFAAKLLDWGYARYGVYSDEGGVTNTVRVRAGVNETCIGEYKSFSAVLDSKELKNVTKEILLEGELSAPIKKGDVIGRVTYRCGDKVIGNTDILCAEGVDRIGFWEIVQRILSIYAIKQPNAKIS